MDINNRLGGKEKRNLVDTIDVLLSARRFAAWKFVMCLKSGKHILTGYEIHRLKAPPERSKMYRNRRQQVRMNKCARKTAEHGNNGRDDAHIFQTPDLLATRGFNLRT